MQRGERGAAAIELALVVMPLLILLLGIIEFGRVYYTQLRLQNAAHETARAIALRYNDPGLLDLGGVIEQTLEGVLGNVDDVTSLIVHLEECDPAVTDPQNAEVVLSDTVDVVLPLPDTAGIDWDALPVTAHATMSCEG